MNIKQIAGIGILIFNLVMGCSGNYGKVNPHSGNYGKVNPQSGSDSKVTQRELIDNWSDYNIWIGDDYRGGLAVIVFDSKNDDRKILVGSNLSKVKDQEMWTEIVKANTASDGNFRLFYWGLDATTGVQEIWGPDSQIYGFTIYQQFSVERVKVKLVDKNTVRVWWERPAAVSHPL
jgi:hypothetical protein